MNKPKPSSDMCGVRMSDLEQRTIITNFFANGDGPWTVVYDEWSEAGVRNGGQFIALSQPTLREMRDGMLERVRAFLVS